MRILSARAGSIFHQCMGAALLLAAPMLASAGAYDGALLKTPYTVQSADINGDGLPDILMTALPTLVTLPLDDDLVAPLPLPTPSPAFLLRSSADGSKLSPSLSEFTVAQLTGPYAVATLTQTCNGKTSLRYVTLLANAGQREILEF
jgi:hypothetical protein